MATTRPAAAGVSRGSPGRVRGAAIAAVAVMASTLVPAPARADHVDTTATVRQLLEDNSSGAARTVGLYLKEVGGPVHAAFNESFVFEPASTIKALIHFYAMRQVEDGTVIDGLPVTLDRQVPWFTGTSGSCPTLTGAASDTLAVGLGQMMVPSDNRWTQALRELFGDPGPLPPPGPINQLATSLGMTDTRLTHLVGCLVSVPPAGSTRGIDDPNMLTLVDAGILYEAVATGYLQDPGAAYGFMLTDSTRFNTVIGQEAAGLGLSAASLADFQAGRQSALKAGSYTGGGFRYRSVAGWAELPFKDAGCAVAPRQFVYGAFIHQADSPPTVSIRGAGVELFREQIRHALDSWAACEADLDQALLTFPGAPAELAVDTPTTLTVRASVRNNGPADSVDGHLTVTATVPADCSVSPAVVEHVVPALVEGQFVSVDTDFEVTCSQPSLHAFDFDTLVVALDPDVVDPDPSDNDQSATLSRPVIAQADLAVGGWDFSALDGAGLGDLLVGQTFSFPTTKVLRNAGDTVFGLYDTPVHARVTRTFEVPAGVRGSVEIGGAEAPADVVVQRPGELPEVHGAQPAGTVVEADGPATLTVTFTASALAVGVDREVVETFGIRCLEGGLHSLTFVNQVAAIDEHIEDPAPADNVLQVDREIDCVTPVAINIRPGNPHNLVNPGGNQSLPVAVLTTAGGEHGLPLAFDATAVDHTTVRFGVPTELGAGGGSSPEPSKELLRDSFEPDDSTKDGDIDLVLHHRVAGSGLAAGDTEACLVGRYLGAGGVLLTFFGCDAVQTVGP